MRYTAEHKQATHARILAAAEKLFRAEGFSGASVERVMRAAGLTVGGFYAHFASKEALLAESLRAFMTANRARWLSGLRTSRGPEFVERFARRYLDQYNRATGDTACMMPSLLSDLTRATPEVQAAFGQGLEELVGEAQAQLPRARRDARQQMLATVALCFGAMTLARATASQPLAGEILDAARALLLAGAPVEEGRRHPALPGPAPRGRSPTERSSACVDTPDWTARGSPWSPSARMTNRGGKVDAMKTRVARAGLLCLALTLGACASVPLAAPWEDTEPLRYDIAYTHDPTPHLNVEVFLPRKFPREFLFRQPGRVESLTAVDEVGTRFELFPRNGVLQVPEGTRVLRYHYPLAASARQGGRHLFGGMGEGDAWHVAGKAYLLTPSRVPPGLRVDLTVSGTEPLLPWTPDASGVYHLRGEDLIDAGFHAFGGRRCEAHVGASVLEVALLGASRTSPTRKSARGSNRPGARWSPCASASRTRASPCASCPCPARTRPGSSAWSSGARRPASPSSWARTPPPRPSPGTGSPSTSCCTSRTRRCCPGWPGSPRDWPPTTRSSPARAPDARRPGRPGRS
ncbi:TetR family transcriptional regulator [Corallococcus sp. 4LFB]|uniref:TetR family transcriptional regulator n=1 Tax=Corallococcus sp. 4LFB TaxID=3383249 RepID=UPI003975D18A